VGGGVNETAATNHKGSDDYAGARDGFRRGGRTLADRLLAAAARPSAFRKRQQSGHRHSIVPLPLASRHPNAELMSV
jgi:hypothetical protein